MWCFSSLYNIAWVRERIRKFENVICWREGVALTWFGVGVVRETTRQEGKVLKKKKKRQKVVYVFYNGENERKILYV